MLHHSAHVFHIVMTVLLFRHYSALELDLDNDHILNEHTEQRQILMDFFLNDMNINMNVFVFKLNNPFSYKSNE